MRNDGKRKKGLKNSVKLHKDNKLRR